MSGIPVKTPYIKNVFSKVCNFLTCVPAVTFGPVYEARLTYWTFFPVYNYPVYETANFMSSIPDMFRIPDILFCIFGHFFWYTSLR